MRARAWFGPSAVAAGGNERVWREVDHLGSTSYFLYFYGVDGVLLQTGTTNSNFDLNVYFAGRQIWAEKAPGLFSQGPVHQDRLGSEVRRGALNSRYFPYGDEATSTANDRTKFATYYRDSVTTLDYARNRYYSLTIGRFTTADPYRASGGPADPQSWNRYAYVQGDPVNYGDPGGLMRNECGVAVRSVGEDTSSAALRRRPLGKV